MASEGEMVMTEMLEKMRVKEGDDDRTVLSKKLSYVLRHGAKQLELQINDGGFVSVRELLAVGTLFAGVGVGALVQFVEQSNQEKKRYEMEEQPDGDFFIRAINKHTIDGLEKPKSPNKERERRPRERRSTDRGQGANGGRSGGAGGVPEKPISEEDFIARWRLDRLARARLLELPKATRQQAMQKFRPGQDVPVADYPKVFVAFCKRFKTAAIAGGGNSPGGRKPSIEVHSKALESDAEAVEEEFSTPMGCSSTMSPKQKSHSAGRPRLEWEGSTLNFEQLNTESRGTEEEPYPVYLSPDHSPRLPEGGCGGSSSGPPSPQRGVLLLGTTPTNAAMSAMQPAEQQMGGGYDGGYECWSPSRRPPAPPQAPAEHLMRGCAQAPIAPPPPQYAPQSVSELPLQLQFQNPRAAPPPPPAHPPKVAGLGLPHERHAQQSMHMGAASPSGGSWSPQGGMPPVYNEVDRADMAENGGECSPVWRQRQAQGQGKGQGYGQSPSSQHGGHGGECSPVWRQRQAQGQGQGYDQWNSQMQAEHGHISPCADGRGRGGAWPHFAEAEHGHQSSQWAAGTWMPRGAAC